MVHRGIDVDEETDRNLTDLALDYGGDLNEALADLMRSRESVEVFLDQQEEAHRASLTEQLRRSEDDFRSGRTNPDEVGIFEVPRMTIESLSPP